MQIHKLVMQAFGPFCKRQEINFDMLTKTPIFLIAGDTGSGKTTIFDAICFALYGEVSGIRKEAKTLKCSYAKMNLLSYVYLEFSVHQKNYKITRYPEQEKVKKDGKITKFSHRAQLQLPDGLVLTKLAEIKRKIEDEILNIPLKNFEKIVMLPQGKFQALLLEHGKTRVETLRSIFGTELYGEIVERLFIKYKGAAQNYENLQLQCNRILKDVRGLILPNDWEENPDRVLITLQNENHKDEQTLQKLDMKQTIAEENLQEFHYQLQSIAKRKEYIKKLKEYENKIQMMDQKKGFFYELKQKNNLLEKVNTVLPFYRSLKQVKEWTEEFKEKEELLKKQIKRIDHSLFQIKESMALVKDDEQTLEIKKQECYQLDQELKTIRLLQEIKTKDQEIQLFLKRFDLSIQLEKLKTEIKLQKEIRSIQIKLASLQKEASETYREYLNHCRTYFEMQAFILAEKLEEGKPCPVCGSLEHPCKAKAYDGSISYDEVDKKRTYWESLEKQIEKLKYDLKLLLMKAEMKKSIEDIQNDYHTLYEEYERIPKPTLSVSREEALQKHLQYTSYLQEHAKINIRNAEEIQAEMMELSREIEMLKNRDKRLKADYQKLSEEKSGIDGQLKQIKKSMDDLHYEKAQKEELYWKALEEERIEEKLFLSLKGKIAELKESKKAIEEFTHHYNQCKGKIEVLSQEIVKSDVKVSEALLQKNYERKVKEKQELENQKKNLLEKLTINRWCEQSFNRKIKELNKIKQQYDSLRKITEIARGGNKRMSFEKYILASFFDEMIFFANLRMESMSNFRYRMARVQNKDSDGISLQVFDIYSGNYRPINTLSGGEIFVASLSMALGLSDVISQNYGKFVLNTLFIDEGFGTLDMDYLSGVINCLFRMEEKRRQIGIISHVSYLKKQIENQILVSKGSLGEGSKIEIKVKQTAGL